MRDSWFGGLIVGVLAMVLSVAVPISTSAQDKKDNSTATNAAEGSEPPVARSASGAVVAATGSAKPNSPVPPPATPYNWTGGYVGAHAGWGWGRADTTFTPLPNATQFIDMRPTTLSPDPSGFSGGAQAGYNWQTGHFVTGAEADISWSRISGTARVSPIIMNNGSPFPGAGFLITHQETKWFGTIRPRAGIAFDRVLIYGTGGLAYGRVNNSANSDFRPGVPTSVLFFQYPVSLSATKTGWTGGFGVEAALPGNHWSWKAEYLYLDLGNQSFTANPVPANPPFQVAYTWKSKLHTFNAGINFRF